MNFSFFYRLIFMAELLLGEALFAYQFKPRSHMVLRTILVLLSCLGLSFVFPAGWFVKPWCSVLYISYFAFTILGMVILFDEPLKNVVFCGILGYTIQHFSSETFELFRSLANVDTEGLLDFYSTGPFDLSPANFFLLFLKAGILFLVYFSSALFLRPKLLSDGVLKVSSVSLLLLTLLILLVDIVIGTVVLFVLPKDLPRLASFLLHLYNLLCCVLTLVLLYELTKRKKAESELLVLKQIRHREQEQYRVSKDNIDLINIKVHDLKHQLQALSEGKKITTGEVKEIERALEIYDTSLKTKNEALNVVLMEKGLLCKKNGIFLSCILDASRLAFMSEEDVYSLFGNLLDNAIEATLRKKEGERSIGFSMKTKGNLLTVDLYNGYEGKLSFSGGLPQTTKKDVAYHGYGMKSIRYTVEKYHGEMKIKAEKGIFDIVLLFPIPSGY